MNFIPLTNTYLLYFLPVAAIPILLHLLTLHRLRTVELSTFRFLFDSYVQQRRRMKFLEALIAMLRTLFLLLLVFMLARPAVQHWNSLLGKSGGSEVVMLMDSSVSMNTTNSGTSALDRAKSAAIKVAQELSPDDRLTLIRVAAKPDEVFSRFSADTTAIRDKIESLQAGSSRANMLATLTQVFGPQAPERVQPTVYFFTDCQASGWREMKGQPIEKLLPEKSKFIVVNVGSNEPVSNRAVVGDVPRQHRSIVGLPIKLRPRVVNYSRTETVDVAVSVQIEGKEISRPTMTLKPGESAVREIDYVPQEPGVLRGRFEIEKTAGKSDGFPDDDSFLFTLSVDPQIKVVLVNGAPSADPFESETLFLKTAMTVGGEDEENTSAAKLPVSTNYVRSLYVNEILEPAVTADSLRDAAVVILANCGALNAAQFTLLRDYVSNGGGMLIFPGDKVNIDTYNKQFFPVPNLPEKRLTAVDLGKPEGDINNPNEFEKLGGDSIDYAHPVLSIFENSQIRYLTTARFFRRYPLEIPAERRNCWAIAAFSSGAPALVESWYGDGIVLLAGFPINSKWSNLPMKPEFVPLILRMVSHVEHRHELEAPSVVSPEGKGEVGVARDWEPVSGKVTDVAGHTTPLDFKQSGSRWLAAVEQTSEKGYYTVDVKGGKSDAAKTGTAAFAVNLSPDESNFDMLKEDQLKSMLPGTDIVFVDASAQAQQEHGSIGDKREIWRPLIWIMFAVIAMEFMLSTLGGQRADTEEEVTVADRILQLNPGTWVGKMTGAGTPQAPAETGSRS